jgi:UDPglucose--hexose-1-phosphate uridylyltransferase
MPQLRQNIITGDWVVIAPERAKRPSDFITSATPSKGDKSDCPFCVENNTAYQKRLPGSENHTLYVLPNKYPAFIEDESNQSPRAYGVEDGFYHARPALGGHDVVVIKDHDLDLYDFEVKHWHELFWAFKKRYEYFRTNQSNSEAYVMPIYNQGPQAGASIEHPHAQIFTSSIVPNIVSREMAHTQRYYEHNGLCAFCEMIAHEKKEKIRIIAENRDFVAFTFFAARFPFETWILPKRHESCFEGSSRETLETLARFCKDVFAKIGGALKHPPLNFFIHSVPLMFEDSVWYHWHMEIGPRVSSYGGYELGSGVIIDVVSPEKAAMYLKGLETD